VEYIQGLSVQTRLFAYFFAFGFLLGVLYDALGAMRVIFFSPRKSLFIFDAVFGSIAAFLTFICLLAFNHGQVQAYILAGEGLGALVYLLSLGDAAEGLRNWLIKAKRKTIDMVTRPAKFLYGKIKSLFVKNTVTIQKFLKKTGNSVKKCLHSKGELSYNNNELSEAESRNAGGKAKGKASRAKSKDKKARNANKSPKAAQPSVGAGGGVVRVPVRLPDDIAEQRDRRTKKTSRRKAKRGRRASKREREI
jgi:hypothetical protein